MRVCLNFEKLHNKFPNSVLLTAIQNELRNIDLNVKPVLPDDIFEMMTVLI